MDFSSAIILGNALLLGVRHGIDWDHIAAISDIVGTAGTTRINTDGSVTFAPLQAVRLSSLYALGHAAIVLALGLVAVQFAKVLPQWIDPVMERAVGVTLLLLSAWILYSVILQLTTDDYAPQSRWMFILKKFHDWKHKFGIRHKHRQFNDFADGESEGSALSSAGVPFVIGVIHGFGAETGTQVLLLAAISGTTNSAMAIALLCSFVVGLLISNTFVAVVASAGFFSSAKFRPVMLTISILACVFSLVVGAAFVTGNVAVLPEFRV
ncbi:MAG TPA: hypothetical protein V6C76_13215 [Drouetiella sp.]